MLFRFRAGAWLALLALLAPRKHIKVPCSWVSLRGPGSTASSLKNMRICSRLGLLASPCNLAGQVGTPFAGWRGFEVLYRFRISESTCLGRDRKVWTATVTNELISIMSLTWAMISLSADKTAPRAELSVTPHRVLSFLARVVWPCMISRSSL